MSSSRIRYTVEELSAIVGMSARTIRAHQTRGLLPPPVRDGRTAYYGSDHRRRLERIIELQNLGFNLVSIAAMLGRTGSGRHHDGTGVTMDDLARDHPAVHCSLDRHGLLGGDESGMVTIAHPELSRVADDLAKAGIPPITILRFLAQLMDRLVPIAGGLLGMISGQLGAAGHCHADLLVSAFRVAVENARN